MNPFLGSILRGIIKLISGALIAKGLIQPEDNTDAFISGGVEILLGGLTYLAAEIASFVATKKRVEVEEELQEVKQELVEEKVNR